MKSIISTLLLLSIVFLTFGQKTIYQHHKINSVTTKVTNPNKPEKSFTLTQKIDKKGNVIEEFKIDNANKKVEHTKTSIEKNKKVTCHLDSEGNIIASETILTNKDGKVIETTSENILKQRKDTRRYNYDKWGKLVEETWLNSQSKIIRIKKYFYNDEGLLVKQISIDESGEIIFQKDISYEE